jgi:hypothetical protein
MLSSVFTSLGIFIITILSYACVHCTPCVLLYDLNLFFPCEDDTPPSCSVSFSGSGYRPCSLESMANSASCGHFPLDASDSICLTSSTNFSRSFSSSTCNVVFSYSGVWISSTSTTMGISLVPPYGTYVLLCVLWLVLVAAPTLGGDMVVKSELESINSKDGSRIPHSITLPLGSTFFSLDNNTMGRFPPSV